MLQALRPYRRTLLVFLLAGSLALLLVSVFAAAPAAGTTRTGHDFTYYSNPGHTGAVVGYRYYCPGYSGGWGTITPYDVINTYPCQ
jgi:hypothetical protein